MEYSPWAPSSTATLISEEEAADARARADARRHNAKRKGVQQLVSGLEAYVTAHPDLDESDKEWLRGAADIIRETEQS